MTAKATFTNVGDGAGSAILVTWNLLTADPNGQAIEYPEHMVRSFQVEGTFGGAVVEIVGSNDGTNFRPVSDQPGTSPLTWTAASDILQVQQVCKKMMPRLSSVGVGADIVVSMLMVRPTPMRT